MTLEDDQTRSTWSPPAHPNPTGWDAMYDDQVMVFQHEAQDEDQPTPSGVVGAQQPEEAATGTSGASTPSSNAGGANPMQNFLHRVPSFLVPVPFALLIFLFTLPAYAHSIYNLPPLPLALILLALVVVQATLLYYVGDDETLWMLFTIGGYALFLLVGAFALFGLSGSLLLLVILVLLGLLLGARALHRVPEGYVDIVLSRSGKYSRTFNPGLNLLFPWETVPADMRILTKEVTWLTNPPIERSISQDQFAIIEVSVSYEVMPDHAHLLIYKDNWENSLRLDFISVINNVFNELKPADYVAWAHQITHRATVLDDDDPMAETRWDRLNTALKRRISEQVFKDFDIIVIVSKVLVKDITVLPRAPASQVTHVPAAPFRQEEPVFQRSVSASPLSPIPAAAPAWQEPMSLPALPSVQVPSPAHYDTIIGMYENIREGRISDLAVILDLAARLHAIASSPEASAGFPFDASKAANSLYKRVAAMQQTTQAAQSQMTAQRASVDAEVTVRRGERERERRSRRPPEENLMIGG